MFNWIKDNPIFFLLIFLAIAAPSLFLGAMQVIFYIVLGIVILMLILGLLFRSKIRRLQREMEEQMGSAAQGQTSQGRSWGGFYSSPRGANSRRGGSEQDDVKIFKQRGSTEKRVSNNVGDYVEFEEIKEEE